MEIEWERIYYKDTCYEKMYEVTVRAQVIGGWLVMHRIIDGFDKHPSINGNMVFIPDPTHTWGNSIMDGVGHE